MRDGAGVLALMEGGGRRASITHHTIGLLVFLAAPKPNSSSTFWFFFSFQSFGVCVMENNGLLLAYMMFD